MTEILHRRGGDAHVTYSYSAAIPSPTKKKLGKKTCSQSGAGNTLSVVLTLKPAKANGLAASFWNAGASGFMSCGRSVRRQRKRYWWDKYTTKDEPELSPNDQSAGSVRTEFYPLRIQTLGASREWTSRTPLCRNPP